jgi:hypothetical protein
LTRRIGPSKLRHRFKGCAYLPYLRTLSCESTFVADTQFIRREPSGDRDVVNLRSRVIPPNEIRLAGDAK